MHFRIRGIPAFPSFLHPAALNVHGFISRAELPPGEIVKVGQEAVSPNQEAR
jgi:hypothetical protein